MSPHSYCFTKSHIPQKAAFPVIDAHNHLWGKTDAAKIIQTMDEVGVVSYCDATANVRIEFGDGGYRLERGKIDDFFSYFSRPYPGRFYCFTMTGFAHPAEEPLFSDAAVFVKRCIDALHDHSLKGARGLKVLKELGLRYRDSEGRLIAVDDERLAPIWEEAGKLGLPVLIHQSDPYGFFKETSPQNEHYNTLRKYPDWSFASQEFPSKEELLARRDRLVSRHKNTQFILPHVANFAENLDYISRLLDEQPNVCIDFSARLDELGRKPYSSREFFLKYQDRILFGTDMPADAADSPEMYRCYFRFLETYDEGFYPPDYDGSIEEGRWPICGIGLPPEVLEKIYYKNAVRIIPGLKAEFIKLV